MSRKILMVTFIIILAGSALFLMGSPCEPEQKPDLIPAKAPGTNSYVSLDNEDNLVFWVKNQGTADAPASTTRVKVLDSGDTYDLTTPAIPAGDTVDTEHLPFTRAVCVGDCNLEITVDYGNAVPESNELNNSASETIVS